MLLFRKENRNMNVPPVPKPQLETADPFLPLVIFFLVEKNPRAMKFGIQMHG